MVSFSGFASTTNTLIYFPDIFQQVRAASVWANKKILAIRKHFTNYLAKQYCFTRKSVFARKVRFFDQKSLSACRSNGLIFFNFWQIARF
jgi:hypothetical protein